MKLELKHLAPYLPYGLKTKYFLSDAIVLNEGQPEELRDKLLTEDNIKFVRNFCKPILRPLSDLTKEIEVNGEKFKADNKFWGFNSFKYYFNQFDKWESAFAYLNSRAPYGLVQVLFEWHFDVFGLIPQGLAIDINTLEK